MYVRDFAQFRTISRIMYDRPTLAFSPPHGAKVKILVFLVSSPPTGSAVLKSTLVQTSANSNIPHIFIFYRSRSTPATAAGAGEHHSISRRIKSIDIVLMSSIVTFINDKSIDTFIPQIFVIIDTFILLFFFVER